MEIGCDSVKARIDNGQEFLLLDCREPDEYETAKIEKAVLIPMSQLQERVGELDAHRESDVVVMCHHGGRSLHVAMWLQQQGFARVQSMAGGIDAWSVSVDPSVPRY